MLARGDSDMLQIVAGQSNPPFLLQPLHLSGAGRQSIGFAFLLPISAK